MTLWQIVVLMGFAFILGFNAGVWIQKQEEPKSETEKSLEEKIRKI